MKYVRFASLRGGLAVCAAALSACAPATTDEPTASVSQGISVSAEIRLDEGSQTTPVGTYPVPPHMVAVRDGWAFAAVGFHPMTGSVPYPTHLFRLRPDLTPIDPGGRWLDYNVPVASVGAPFTEIVDDGAGGAWVASGQALSHMRADGTLDPTVRIPSTIVTFARDGADLLVLGSNGDTAPYGLHRIRSDGTFVTPPIATFARPVYQINTRITPTASGVLVTWQQSVGSSWAQSVFYLRVARDGRLLDPAEGVPVTAVAADRQYPDVATDGTRWFLTWTAMAGSGSRLPGVYWTILDADGNTVGAPVNYAGAGTSSGVGWNGSHFLLAWRDGANARSVRVTAAGSVVDATPTSWNVYREGRVTVRASGSEFLVASELGNVWAQRVSATNTLVGPTSLILGYDFQTDSPHVCFDGTNFRARWRAEHRMSTTANLWEEERTARFSPLGARIDATATALPTLTTPFYGEGSYAARAACRPDAMISFGHNVVTTTAAGVVTGGVRAFNPAQSTPMDSVATPYGFMTLVRRSTGLAAWRIAPTGEPLDPLPIDLSGSRISRLVSDRTGQLGIAVSEFDMPGCNAFITRITNEGDVLDPVGRTLSWPTPPDHCPLSSSSIAAASDGTQHMIAWVYGTLGGACGAMYCMSFYWARISPSGALLDTTPRTISLPQIRSVPGLTWDGRTWNLFWVDNATRPHVRVLRLQRDGTLYDTTPLDLGVFDDATTFVRPSSSTNGTTAMVYSHLDDRSGSFRGFARVFVNDAPVPDGGTLDAGSDATVMDAASDARTDTGAVDSGVDARTDTGAVDSGVDVRTDTGAVDSGVDAVVAVDVMGMADAGTDVRTDSGADAGSVDAGSVDAGSVDAGSVDAGSVDAGSVDAGTDMASADADSDASADAASVDASRDGSADAARDGAVADAARDVAVTDSGVTDGAVVDAGAPPPADDGGCSASPRASHTNGVGLAGAVVMLSMARRRRRRRNAN